MAANPRNWSWVGTLGLTMYRCGKDKEAMQRFQRALRQPIDWRQRLEWQWLREEAEGALKAVKPGEP